MGTKETEFPIPVHRHQAPLSPGCRLGSRKKQGEGASFALRNSASQADRLNTFRINLNCYYRGSLGTIGGTLSCFPTTGDKDTLLYAPASVSGSATGSPDSWGFTLEADYLPRDTLKVTLQYSLYGKFNGARSNDDGLGRTARDNNTFFFLLLLLLGDVSLEPSGEQGNEDL